MKKLLTFSLFSLLVMSILPMVSAYSLFGNTINTLDLNEKNPSDWTIVPDGAYGEVIFSTVGTPWRIFQERVRVSAWNLEPRTEYQLIYYGNNEFNDVYPYVTCIGKSKTTSLKGYFKSGSSVFNHLPMWDDDIDQKFWVVLSSDVDCKEGKMTDWNPTEYLFESNTI